MLRVGNDGGLAVGGWVAAEDEGADECSDSVCGWNRQLNMEQEEGSLEEPEGVVRERGGELGEKHELQFTGERSGTEGMGTALNAIERWTRRWAEECLLGQELLGTTGRAASVELRAWEEGPRVTDTGMYANRGLLVHPLHQQPNGHQGLLQDTAAGKQEKPHLRGVYFLGRCNVEGGFVLKMVIRTIIIPPMRRPGELRWQLAHVPANVGAGVMPWPVCLFPFFAA